jgi:signal transduction histidine kinase
MNEELQSANEELETSKEELQSFNEELSTVNSQLQDKMEELEKANNDFRNLLNSTEIPTVFLDTDLRIVRFTPATVHLLHLIESDTGRPIRDFAFRFTDKTLLQDAGRSEEGRSYLRQIRPFRTTENRIEGVAITFLDISERNALQRQLLTIASDESRHIGQDLHDSVGQSLTGLALLAGSLAESLQTTAPDEVNAANRIAQGLSSALEQLRKLSKGLLPVEVEANGLAMALSGLAETTSYDSGLRCEFDLIDPVPIEDNETATQLYRIAQEAVANASKSGAKLIKIALVLDTEQIVLSIRDDGRGITPSAWDSQGIGLKTMQYRAGLLGATLSINVLSPRGTLVSCRLFVNRNPKDV